MDGGGVVRIVGRDKLILAQIDPCVFRRSFIFHPEEQHIARLQIVLGNGGAALIHVPGKAGNRHALFRKAVVDQPGVVKAIRPGGTHFKGGAHQCFGQSSDLRSLAP